MDPSVDQKIASLLQEWRPLTPQERHHRLISLGRSLPPYPPSLLLPQLKVSGCQSSLYLSSTLLDDKVHFEATSDALLSAGLVALLLHLYNDLPPETLLQTSLEPLAPLELSATLSPNRSNGLANIHLRMRRDAVQYLKKVSL